MRRTLSNELRENRPDAYRNSQSTCLMTGFANSPLRDAVNL